MLVVQRLAGVLLQVQALDADANLFERSVLIRADLDHDRSLAHDGLVVLRDLVALRQIRIEIVLPGEDGAAVDLRLQAEAGAHRLSHALLVDDRQHAGHGGVHDAHVIVRAATESRWGAREKLRFGRDLRVHLEADDDLPVAGRAGDQILRIGIAAFDEGHARSEAKGSHRLVARRSRRKATHPQPACSPHAAKRNAGNRIPGRALSRVAL
jgi:hypothetical protein